MCLCLLWNVDNIASEGYSMRCCFNTTSVGCTIHSCLCIWHSNCFPENDESITIPTGLSKLPCVNSVVFPVYMLLIPYSDTEYFAFISINLLVGHLSKNKSQSFNFHNLSQSLLFSSQAPSLSCSLYRVSIHCSYHGTSIQNNWCFCLFNWKFARILIKWLQLIF